MINPTNGSQTAAADERQPHGSDYSPAWLCQLPPVPDRVFSANVNPHRAGLIRYLNKKWVNGTVLHYHFFDTPAEWSTTEGEKQIVRDAFDTWKSLGIGLTFREVASPGEAEIRIGFKRGDGAWSYVGRDIIDLGIGQHERTMNFGWDVTTPGEIDTAIHEIGHTLGFPHEHQNPYAGIVWNEEAVYTALAQPPNRWPRETTYHNIIRKIPTDQVQGSGWDPNSIMHYPFGPGLINEPAEYRNGLFPQGGLSERDGTWVKTFYPLFDDDADPELKPAESVKLMLAPGEQLNFKVQPAVSRRYNFGTFGVADTVMVLFEDVAGELRYVAGDDDSGFDRNAFLRVKLFAGRRYILRVRLYYAAHSGETALMMW